eukprot:scaffold725_cov117-Isochrysis_galbana.AAC.4
MATETPPSPKRPRDPSSDNKVSQRATSFDPVWPERQIVTTGNQPIAHSTCQCIPEPCTFHHPYGSVAQPKGSDDQSHLSATTQTSSADNSSQRFHADGGVSGARCGVQGAKACASLSFRGRRVKS